MSKTQQVLPSRVQSAGSAESQHEGTDVAVPSITSRARVPNSDVARRIELQDMLHRHRKVLWHRKLLITSLTLLATLLGGIRALTTPPLYSSTVRLQVDRHAPRVVDAGATAPLEGSESDFMRTQFELLMSRMIAERVVAALRLDQSPEFMTDATATALRLGAMRPAETGRSEETRASGSKLAALAVSRVLQGRAVRLLPGSRLIDITCTAPTPALAQAIAAAYASSFMTATLEKRFQANAYARSFLDEQLKRLKERLEQSERELLTFAEGAQIVIVNEKASEAESNIAAANVALSGIVNERIRNEKSWNQVAQAKASSIVLPQLLSNPVIEGLRARRNALETEYREKLETFKPGYPAMVQIRNKVREIDKQLKSEVEILKASFKAAYENSLSQEAELRTRIERLREEMLDLQKRSVQFNIIKREVDTNRQLYDGLLQRSKEVDIASGIGANSIFVIDAAELPSAPSSPRTGQVVLLSLLIGLVLAYVAAYALDRLDDKIRTPDDIEALLDLATLGVIPRTLGRGLKSMDLRDPRSPVAEAYRNLCSAMLLASSPQLPPSLFVTSTCRSEGRSWTSIAIAQQFASHGFNVLLVDADMRNPALHARLKISPQVGLSSFLSGWCTLSEAIQSTATPNLFCLSAGPIPTDPALLLAGQRFQTLMSSAPDVFDLLVLDGPPVMGDADAAIISNAAASTILVVGAGEARMKALVNTVGRLQRVRATVLGAVLTKHDPGRRHVNANGYEAFARLIGLETKRERRLRGKGPPARENLQSGRPFMQRFRKQQDSAR